MRSFPRKLTIWKPSINNAACFAIAGPEHHHPILTNPNKTCWYANSPVFWICSSAFFAASIVAFSCLKSISFWKTIDSSFMVPSRLWIFDFQIDLLLEFVKVEKRLFTSIPGIFFNVSGHDPVILSPRLAASFSMSKPWLQVSFLSKDKDKCVRMCH